MIECSNCKGGGLVGTGEQPWLRLGHLSTCTKCLGTGKVAEAPQASVPTDGEEKKDGEPTDPDQNGSAPESVDNVDQENATLTPEQQAAQLG